MAALSAIVGIGASRIGRDPIGTPRTLAAEAVLAAMRDAGVTAADVDGLLLNPSALAEGDALPLKLQEDIGLPGLRLLTQIDGKGSSVLQMLQYATLAIRHGMASVVACVFADAPVGAAKAAGQSYRNASPLTGIPGWEAQYGLFGPAGAYALAAMRYLHTYGISERQLGAYAVACRRWAALNPGAMLRKPLSIDDYLAARYIAEPLRLFDCAYPVNGGMAVIVAAAERAGDFAQRAVYVHGLGQAHRPVPRLPGGGDDNATAGVQAGADAYRMAGIAPADVTLCEFYDAFSYCALAALEDYGLCARGDAASFVDAGDTSPGGRLPVNTGGGHLAGNYLQGMTPLVEAVVQGRGAGGARQVARADVILVNGSGGTLEHHSAAILSPLTTL